MHARGFEHFRVGEAAAAHPSPRIVCVLVLLLSGRLQLALDCSDDTVSAVCRGSMRMSIVIVIVPASAVRVTVRVRAGCSGCCFGITLKQRARFET